MRWLRGIVLVGFVGVAVVVWLGSSATWSAGGLITSPPEAEHTYPVQSFPPYTPPHYLASVEPVVPSVSCPSWAPTLIHHADGTYECRAYIPPDPKTGPHCTTADGGYAPPVREPDGTVDCG